jgi:hypothetical protein
LARTFQHRDHLLVADLLEVVVVQPDGAKRRRLGQAGDATDLAAQLRQRVVRRHRHREFALPRRADLAHQRRTSIAARLGRQRAPALLARSATSAWCCSMYVMHAS